MMARCNGVPLLSRLRRVSAPTPQATSAKAGPQDCGKALNRVDSPGVSTNGVLVFRFSVDDVSDLALLDWAGSIEMMGQAASAHSCRRGVGGRAHHERVPMMEDGTVETRLGGQVGGGGCGRRPSRRISSRVSRMLFNVSAILGEILVWLSFPPTAPRNQRLRTPSPFRFVKRSW